MLRKKQESPASEDRKWTSQIRKGSLEMCLLGVIASRPRYGFEIVQYLNGSDLAVTEGTIYPLLNRLQNEGLIDARWQESANGPPRKYYAQTEAGAAAFFRMRDEWRQYAASVEQILAQSEAEPLPHTMEAPLRVDPKA